MIINPLDVTIDPIDPEACEAQILPLLSSTMIQGYKRFSDSSYWRWKHVDNPAGKSMVFAGHNQAGEIVCVRAFMRWRIMLDGESRLAFRPVDAATRSDFQRLGLFSRATIKNLEAAKPEGAALSFGNPNLASLGGYQKLGWSVLTQMYMSFTQASTGGSFRAFGRGALGAIVAATKFRLPVTIGEKPSQPATISLVDDLHNALTHLAQRNGIDESIHTDHSHEFLRWRYVDDPRFEHGIHVESKAGEPQWAATYRISKTRRGRRNLVIGQFASDDKRGIPSASIIDSLKQLENCDSVGILGIEEHDEHGPLRSSVFNRSPNVAYTVTYRPLVNESIRGGSVSNWHLDLVDFLGI